MKTKKVATNLILFAVIGTTPSMAATSLENRQDSSINITAEVGTSVYPHPTAGVNLGYFLNDFQRLEASYSGGEFSFLGEKIAAELYELRMRTFLGNSFYLSGGLAYRKLQLSIDEWLLSDRTLIHKIHHTAATVSIGNNWQFSSFTLGCDWIGYTFPINKTLDERNATGNTVVIFGGEKDDYDDDDDDFDTEERWEKYASGPTLQAVRFYLGWGF